MLLLRHRLRPPPPTRRRAAAPDDGADRVRGARETGTTTVATPRTTNSTMRRLLQLMHGLSIILLLAAKEGAYVVHGSSSTAPAPPIRVPHHATLHEWIPGPAHLP